MKRLLLLTAFLLILAPGARAESPIHGVTEVRIGLYTPAIDDEFSGTGPYKSTFGDDSMWTFGMEADYHLWRGFGSLGIFGSAAWAHNTGNGLLDDGTAAADTTGFHVMPFTAGLVYRFDVLAVRYNIPFVLALKGGPTYALWWITNDAGEVTSYTDANDNDTRAIGGTYGLTGGIALHLLLDIFEPHSAKVFDNEMGVNNSYMFIEMNASWLNDFGSDKSMDLSDTSLVFGLAFEL